MRRVLNLGLWFALEQFLSEEWSQYINWAGRGTLLMIMKQVRSKRPRFSIHGLSPDSTTALKNIET